MKLGYLLVSTEDQCIDRQVDALDPICDDLFVEQLSATARQRPVYTAVSDRLMAGDTLVILDLDRAFRSAKDALTELDSLTERGIAIHIVSMQIDTSTPHGKLLYTFISGLAEFERHLLSQRTKQGLAAARKRGRKLGRRPKMSDQQVRDAKARLQKPNTTLASVAQIYGVHPWTLKRSIRRLDAGVGGGLAEADAETVI
ncbi:MAG: recombinase family protein [Pseudomonadota bacterium]